MKTDRPDRLELASIDREIINSACIRIINRHVVKENEFWQSRNFKELQQSTSTRSGIERMRMKFAENGIRETILDTFEHDHLELISELINMVREKEEID